MKASTTGGGAVGEPARLTFCIREVGTGKRPTCLTETDRATFELEHRRLAPGAEHAVSLVIVDAANNVVREERLVTTLSLDEPPSVAIEGPAAGAALHGTSAVEALFSAAAGQPVTLSVALVDEEGELAAERIVADTAEAGVFERLLALDTRTVPDGTYTLRVLMKDLDGFEANATIPVIVDNTAPGAPAVELVAVVGQDGWFVTPPVALFRAEDGATGVDRFLVTAADLTAVVPARRTLTGDGRGEWALDDVGASRFRVEAVDAAGNVGPERVVDVRFDPTPPSAVLAPLRAAAYANATGLTVPVEAFDPESGIRDLRLFVDDEPVTPWLAPAPTLSARRVIEPGEHVLTLVARNGAGVASDALGAVASLPLFVDRDAPVLRTAHLGPGGTASATASTTLEIVATDLSSEVSELRHHFTGQRWSAWTDATRPVPLTIPVPDVPMLLEVQARDRAGNPSEVLTLTVVHDTAAPAPPGRPAPVRESRSGLGLVWPPAQDNHAVDRYLVYASTDGTHFRLIGESSENRFRDSTVILGLATSYRVVAVDEAGWRSEPGPAARLVPDALSPMAPPRLSEGRHSPPAGTTRTLFVFEVVYEDADNQQPEFIVLELDGARHALTRASAADWDCRDGCIFATALALDPTTLTRKHTYRFAASDSLYTVAEPADATETLPGPLVTLAPEGEEGGIAALRVVPAGGMALVPLLAALAVVLGARRARRGGDHA